MVTVSNKLDIISGPLMGSMLFRDPQTLSSTLAALGILQPRVIASLNHVDTLDSVSNYYLEYCVEDNLYGVLIIEVCG